MENRPSDILNLKVRSGLHGKYEVFSEQMGVVIMKLKTIVAGVLLATMIFSFSSCGNKNASERTAQSVESVNNTVACFLNAYINSGENVGQIKMYVDEQSSVYKRVAGWASIPIDKKILGGMSASDEIQDMLMEKAIKPLRKISRKQAEFSIVNTEFKNDEAVVEAEVNLPTLHAGFFDDLYGGRELSQLTISIYEDEYFGENDYYKYRTADEKTKEAFQEYIMKREMEYAIAGMNLEDYVVDRLFNAEFGLKNVNGEWKIHSVSIWNSEEVLF